MNISILFFGDIVGHPGRDALAQLLPELREQYKPDVVFANAENATHGKGISKQHYDELSRLGIDAFSTGDHIWQSSDIAEYLDDPDIRVIRPGNYHGVPGKGFVDVIVKGKRVRLVNLIGRVFTGANVDNPFLTYDAIAHQYPEPDVVVVDFHAEATSEKRSFAEYVDGRASLVVGTHTHVPTADSQVLTLGTAFISDVGMVGPQDSCLGADKNGIIKNFLTGMPWRYTVAEGRCELGAVFCEVDLEQKVAVRIEHIRRFTS